MFVNVVTEEAVLLDVSVPPCIEVLAVTVVNDEAVNTDDVDEDADEIKLWDESSLNDPVSDESAELLDIKTGEAVTAEVKDDFELEEMVKSGDVVDDILAEIETTKTVAVTDIAALDVPEAILDDEITDETVGNCSAVVILEIEAYDVTVAETEILLDLIALKDETGLRESTDADDEDVILCVSIEERDNNGEDVDDNEATDETLPRAEKDVKEVSVL